MVSGKKPTPDDIHMYGKFYEQFVMKPVSFPVLFDVVSRVLSPPVMLMNPVLGLMNFRLISPGTWWHLNSPVNGNT